MQLCCCGFCGFCLVLLCLLLHPVLQLASAAGGGHTALTDQQLHPSNHDFKSGGHILRQVVALELSLEKRVGGKSSSRLWHSNSHSSRSSRIVATSRLRSVHSC